MNLETLEKFLKDNSQPKFRLEQILKAVYRDGASSFLDISTIPKDLKEELNKEIKILSFDAEKILISKDKRSTKALLKLNDGNKIETVLLSARAGEYTVCVSSQVGCLLNCAFCATGKAGFKRNLTAEEISDQVLFWKEFMRINSKFKIQNSKLTNVVYMGMGEPMLNLEAVEKSIGELIDPKIFAMGSRSISVSTVGIPEKIEDFWKKFPQINLAISLHFADNDARSCWMPINKKYNLESLRAVLQNYFKNNKRKIFLEYIMFENINDSLGDAEKLIVYLQSIGNVYLLHINLISYNITSGNFRSSSKDTIIKFRNYLLKNKVNVTIRKSLGVDIAGACGQLAGK
jgi:23S rRNA (adenine(2503)-C(2))-methyltransferase